MRIFTAETYVYFLAAISYVLSFFNSKWILYQNIRFGVQIIALHEFDIKVILTREEKSSHLFTHPECSIIQSSWMELMNSTENVFGM